MNFSVPDSQNQTPWFPQLDGLRAIAVILVFIHHWTSHGMGVGFIGVQLFFVLSGFLITGILLRERMEVEAGSQSIGFSVKQFYIRRFLRIFPLYYFCLLVCLALGRFALRSTFLWHFFYLSNVLFLIKNDFLVPFNHFWSLAVEEQFYLFWPWVVLLCARRRLPIVLIVLIALAPLSRLAVLLSGRPSFIQTSIMVWNNFDTLGMGALIACAQFATQSAIAKAKGYLNWAIPFCLAELVISRLIASPAFGIVFDPLAVSLLSVWAVWSASRGFTGLTGKVLTNTVVAYLGRISYGLYVWHMFAPAFVRNILRVLHLPPGLNDGAPGFALLFAWTLATASLTWFLFERPVNGLKRYFPYRKTTFVAPSLAEAAVTP